MPLSEFLRMASGKVEAAEQKSTNCSADLSSLHEDGLAELVWNNDQVMIQSQSNRARKNPAFNQFPSEAPGMRDNRYLGGGNRSNSKAAKFAAVQSLMDDDGGPSVPSAAILNQDNDIEPWLNAQAYISDPLPEISGVTANEPSLYGSFALMNKRNGDGKFGHSQNVAMNIRVNSELHNSSSTTGLFNPYDSNQGELSVPLIGSRVSHYNSSTQNSNVFFGNSNQGQTSEKSFMSMLPEKHSLGTSGSGPQPQPQPQRVLNFTNFSRPAALYRSNLQKSDGGLDASCSSSGIKRTQNEDAVTSCIPIKSTNFQPSSTRKEMGSCNEINLVSTKADSGPSVVKSPVKLCSDEEPPYSVSPEDSIKNDKSHSCDAHIAKGFTVGDKTAEPLLAASSVCSGNSAEMASNDQTRKRKDRDNEESDSRSEDNEEESVGRKKAAPGRGVSGSKRSRAAEVHNLSERKRRDRINEKMRALQELIPNCNKADKASMLDEAIEYLKNLQLQVQVMSMGAGFCMPRMMFPTALPPMHAAHMPHFPQVGGGMGFGMGMGFDMNSGVPRFPVFPMSTMQGARFSSPPMYGPSTYQGLAAGHNFQFFGLPAQGLPVSVPRAPPLFPSSGQPPISLTAGVSNTQQVGDAPKTYPVIYSDASVQNKSLQPVSDACARTTMDRMPSQSEAVNGAFDHPLSIRKDDKVLDACGTTSVNLTNTKDDVSSKEGSH